MKSDPISSIVANNLCTGCGACAGVYPTAIKMVEDPINGKRPVVEDTELGRLVSQQAAKICAGASYDWSRLETKDKLDDDWGPILGVWEGWAVWHDIRFRGSSGGAVTALSEFAISSGLVDGIAHTAADPSDPRVNTTVVSQNRNELMRGAGSRYAQASPAEALGALFSKPQKLGFVGKPCDIASIYKAKEELDGRDRIPLTIAIFCAGAPNLYATTDLLSELQVPTNAKLVNLSYRGNGWPGKMRAVWQDKFGKQHQSKSISYSQGWGGILQSGRRWRCRVCADHTGAFADISVGDPWHAPPTNENEAGRSLIIARTPAGVRLIENAIKAGVLIAERRSRGIIEDSQPNLKVALGAVWGRTYAMRVVGLPAPKTHGQKLFRSWIQATAKRKFQSLAGTWKRILRDKLWKPVNISSDFNDSAEHVLQVERVTAQRAVS